MNNLEVDLPSLTICKPDSAALKPDVLKSQGLNDSFSGLNIRDFKEAEDLGVNMREALLNAYYTPEELIYSLEITDHVDYLQNGIYGIANIELENMTFTVSLFSN